MKLEVLFHTFLTWAQVGSVLSASYPGRLNAGQRPRVFRSSKAGRTAMSAKKKNILSTS